MCVCVCVCEREREREIERERERDRQIDRQAEIIDSTHSVGQIAVVILFSSLLVCSVFFFLF